MHAFLLRPLVTQLSVFNDEATHILVEELYLHGLLVMKEQKLMLTIRLATTQSV